VIRVSTDRLTGSSRSVFEIRLGTPSETRPTDPRRAQRGDANLAIGTPVRPTTLPSGGSATPPDSAESSKISRWEGSPSLIKLVIGHLFGATGATLAA